VDDFTLLRHLLATLAYRAAKVMRDVPTGFATFGDGPGRRPVNIVAHMADLMEWGTRLAAGEYRWSAGGGEDWDAEVQRFLQGMRALDDAIVTHRPGGRDAEMLISGPLADALTHVGQLAMLRRAAGAPVRPESYARADITIGRLGLDQAAPNREFDGDASAKR
jgi:hypothetical protein